MVEKLSTIFCVFLVLFACVALVSTEEEFHEELYVKTIGNGDVFTFFQFTTFWDVNINDNNSFTHYNLFPKSFGQIINKYKVEELHLSLTQGLWSTRIWGHNPQSSPPGAELAVWFQQSAHESVDEEWRGLTNALSGQFCASLNFIKAENTVSPRTSFRRDGATIASNDDSKLLRYAMLPHEIVCTENLTPWKKLLPCDSKSGVASLINSMLIYKVKYHSMAVHLRTICKDIECTTPVLELRQTLSVVIDPVLRSGAHDWSFRKLFGTTLKSSCSLAKTSQILVDVTGNNSVFSLKPKPTKLVQQLLSNTSQDFGVYDLKSKGKIRKLLSSSNGFNLVFKWKKRSYTTIPPHFFAHRFLTGFGQEKGGIQTVFYNQHKTSTITLVYYQLFPWYFRTFLHTLKIKVNKDERKPDNLHYIPSKDRERPTSLEFTLTIPPSSYTTVNMQFKKVFLKWTEHPPDAHHGFYIASGVITARLETMDNYTLPCSHTMLLTKCLGQDSWEHGGLIRLYTEALLVTLPTPDFSMPYNVICLTCTVVAIGFGSIYNLATKQLEEVDPNEPTGLLGKAKVFLQKVKSKIFRKRKEVEKND